MNSRKRQLLAEISEAKQKLREASGNMKEIIQHLDSLEFELKNLDIKKPSSKPEK